MTVSLFTMLVTLFMLGVGSFAESFGLRRAIARPCSFARWAGLIYACCQASPGGGPGCGRLCSLVLVAAGDGILQPTCYSGVKQFTDERPVRWATR